MMNWWQDFRHSLRALVKNPGFSLVVVLTLALGIGASTAIFSLMYGILLRPLSYPEADQIVRVFQIGKNGNHGNFSDPNFEDLRQTSRSFQAIAQYSAWAVSVTGGSEPVRLVVATISREFFTVMGAAPMVGRAFLDEELHEGGLPAIIVSHAFWKRYLGGTPELSTKGLKLFDRVFTVVGAMPPGFDFPSEADLWVPRESTRPKLPSRTAHNWEVIGRLKDIVSLEQAAPEASVIARALKEQHGEDTWMVDAAVIPLHEELVGRSRLALLVLFGAGGFLLLVACANVANLLVARAVNRQREFAVRLALGANRWRLAREFLAETLLLSSVGAVAGVVLAYRGVDAFLLFAPGKLPRTEAVAVDLSALLFSGGISVAIAVALSLACVWQLTGRDVQESLNESGRSQVGAKSSERLRRALVVVQVAVTIVLLAGAGLVGRSFLEILEVDLGFRTQGGVVMHLHHSRSPADEAERARVGRFYQELLERLKTIPGVEEVGGVNAFPLTGMGANGQFLIVHPGETFTSREDFSRFGKDPQRVGYAEFRIASEGYFRAMQIPLLRGRMFEEQDSPTSIHVALISQSLARERWPDEHPIGKQIQFGNMDGDLTPFRIIGIVGDVRESGADTEPPSMFYAYYKQRPRFWNFSIVLAGAAELTGMISSEREILRRLDPEIPPHFLTLEEIFASSVADRRSNLIVLGTFAATALVLAMLGIYGVITYSVVQRTREIGVRSALGARPADIVSLVLSQGLRLVGLGLIFGLLATFALTRILTSFLFGISPTDPITFAGVSLLLVALGLLACLIPAHRASKVDPMVALRYE